jgi:G:T-mismatch repair DNA endonuclease (very short patch repair protein)
MTQEEKLKYARDLARKKREEGQTIIWLNCKICGESTPTKEYLIPYFTRRGGQKCQKCVSKTSADVLKKLRALQTPEEKSAFAKFARSKADCSKGVKKQWDNFKADPEKFKQICKAKSDRMKRVWAEYDDATKNHIAKSLTKSHNKSRSTSSEALKQLMVDYDLYQGFQSEEPFHGFLPDEINHSLRIIVEMYGDVYHCNPRKYKDPNQFLRIIGRTVGEQWKRDERRLACFYKHGYSVVIVWDSDFRKNPEREINRIRDAINTAKQQSSINTPVH